MQPQIQPQTPPQIQPQMQPTQQTVPPIAPIDPQPLLEHGESTTAIILSIAMLISIVVGSITRLVYVIGMTRAHR